LSTLLPTFFGGVDRRRMRDRLAKSQPMQERLPIPELQEYLACVWIKRVGPESLPIPHRTIPNGSAELLCIVGSIPRLVGPQTGPTEELLAPSTVAIGVRFRPGVGPPVLGEFASELLDRDSRTDDLWGRVAIELAEEIAEAASPEAALASVEAALLKRITTRAATIDPLALEIVRQLLVSPDDGVGSLASSLYISERQLRRRCERATGVGPKTLQRVFRFQRLLSLAHAEGAPRPNLGRLAHDAGYSDQSHLARESARLTGRTPRAVLDDCRRTHDHSLSHRLFLAGALSCARSLHAAA
jgi:AraC-like DNA-binding protein